MKSVATVTLTEARARAALKTISARNNANPRMFLVLMTSMANGKSREGVGGRDGRAEELGAGGQDHSLSCATRATH